MYAIKKILLTTDFSETSKAALDPARGLARCFDAKIVLVYVEEDKLPPLVVEYMAVGIDELLTQQVEQSEKRLEQFQQEQLPDFDVERVVGVGTPHVEIVRIAEEQAVDLIVIATHGRGLISHALLGSTAERVVRRAPCPVLVSRAAATD